MENDVIGFILVRYFTRDLCGIPNQLFPLYLLMANCMFTYYYKYSSFNLMDKQLN